jgi:hypothetical protein
MGIMYRSNAEVGSGRWLRQGESGDDVRYR